MKKLLSAALIITGFLLAPLYPVFAQTTAITPRPLPLRPEASISAKPLLIGRENLASRSAELKAKLLGFRDKQKATMVQRINDTLAMINKNRTDTMLKRLDVMTRILTRLESKTSEASVSAKLTTSPQGSLDQAKLAIDSATKAVQAQAEMDYTIKVSSESGVRTDAQEAREKLHTDLKTVNEQVIAAKKALSQSIQTILQSLGGATNGQ